MFVSARANSPAPLQVHRDTGEALLQTAAVIALVGVSVASLTISATFGIAVTLTMTASLCIFYPAAAPILLIAAFLYQNLFVAVFSPLVSSPEALDTLRGANFAILVAASSLFTFAAFLEPRRLPLPSQRWLLALVALAAIVIFYLGLGILRGAGRDAVVYFRNIAIPLGCFATGLIAASVYRVELGRSLVWLAGAALAYGYFELFFTTDFLALFNGDTYLESRIAGRIEAGYWQRIMEQTGFVLTDVMDGMTVPFLNLPLLKDLMPSVFRLSGPNFHPISFAYALAIAAVWLLFRRGFLFLILALPILLVVGSKGALVLVGFAVLLKLAMPLVGARAAFPIFAGGLGVYLTLAIVYGQAVRDYHVLGLLAGLREFFANPFGRGLGFGGNLSSTIEGVLDWNISQQQGIANVPVESAIGVMLYQMGVGTFAYLAFIAIILLGCKRLFSSTGDPAFLFSFASAAVITANGLLQEEAMFAPLALGLCLLLTGVEFGNHWRNQTSMTLKRPGV
jgi:hypothetical protein